MEYNVLKINSSENEVEIKLPYEEIKLLSAVKI